ncbi:MAG: carbohydrate ABC transporter permease [Anaerolineae bacterium]
MTLTLRRRLAQASDRRQLWRDAWGYGLASPWIVGFLVFTLVPTISSIYLSFTTYDVFTPPKWVGIANYQTMFAVDPRYWVSLFNTVYYAAFSVPLSIGLALTIAVLLNQGLPGQNVFRTLYYMPSVVSGVAVSMLWLWLFDPTIGLVNNFLNFVGIAGPAWLQDPHWAKPALILMSLWGIGGEIVIFLAGLQGVPQEMYEAAMVDGANWWHKVSRITIPMITPAIFFNLIMGVIGSFQVFTQAYVMTRGGPVNSTLFYLLYLYLNAFRFFQMGYASAMAWVLFVIILVLTLIQFRVARRWVYYEAGSTQRGVGAPL